MIKDMWEKYKLSDLGTVVGGATPSTAVESYYGGDIPWLTPKDLSSFTERYILGGERNITEEGLHSCSAKILPKGSVLFSSRAPIGYVAIALNPVATNQGFKSIIPNANVDSLFLYYLLKYNKGQIEAMGSGTTFKEVSGSVMKNIEVFIPALLEQRRIAGILGALDDKIELNNRINANLEAQATAIFRSWFVDFEFPNADSQPYKSSGGEFIDSPLGKIPKGWKVVKLGDICNAITKGTTPTTLKKAFTISGVNFIKAESILDNHDIDTNKIAFIDDETNKLLSRSVIKQYDILFTIAGTIGRFCCATKSIVPANTNQAVAIIRVNDKIVSPIVIYSFFIGSWHTEFYIANIQQAVQANLSLTSIKDLPILLPNKEQLVKYEKLITPFLNSIWHNNSENKTLATLRNTLLPKLMNNEI